MVAWAILQADWAGQERGMWYSHLLIQLPRIGWEWQHLNTAVPFYVTNIFFLWKLKRFRGWSSLGRKPPSSSSWIVCKCETWPAPAQPLLLFFLLQTTGFQIYQKVWNPTVSQNCGLAIRSTWTECPGKSSHPGQALSTAVMRVAANASGLFPNSGYLIFLSSCSDEHAWSGWINKCFITQATQQVGCFT